MGLPGVHNKLWPHQSSLTVSYLPYQPLHFYCTTLVWPVLPKLVQLLIQSSDQSLLPACGGIHPSIHPSSSNLSICPPSHPTILLFSHRSIYPSIHLPTQPSFHLLPRPSTHLPIHPFFQPSMYSLIHTSNTHCSYSRPGLLHSG